MIPLLRSTIILTVFLGSIAALAQPVPPVAVDTAWEAFPRAIGVQCQYAKMDRNGNLLCGIILRDTVTFGSEKIIVTNDHEDIGVAKFRSDGTPLWIRPTGYAPWQNLQGFDIDSNGNSFALYFVRPNPTLDSLKIGNLRLTTDGGVFLVKYSPSGDLLWTTWLGDSISTHSVAADGSGGAIVAGGITGRSIYGDDTLTVPGKQWDQNRYAAAVISVASDGSFRWARESIRKNGASAYNVAIAPNGDIILSGILHNVTLPDTLIIGNSRITNPGLYVARYRSTGDLIWARGITSGPIELYTEGVAFDSTGNIILAGRVDYHISSLDFGKRFWDTLGTAGAPIRSYGVYDIFLAKLSGDGRFLWSTVLGGRDDEAIGNIHVTPDGEFLLTGTLSGHVKFGGYDYYAQGRSAAFAATYDKDGRPGWMKIYDPRGSYGALSGGRSTWAIASQFDRQGRLWMIGGFSGIMRFDSFTLGTGNSLINTFTIRLAPGTYPEPARIWTQIDAGLPYNMHSYGAPDVRSLALFGGQLYAGLAPGDAAPWLDNTGSGIYSSSDRGKSWNRNTGGDHPGDSLRYGTACFATLDDSLYTVTALLTLSSDYYSKAMVMGRTEPHRWAWLKRSGNPDLHAVFTVDGTLYGAPKGSPDGHGLLRWNPATATWSDKDTSSLGKLMVRKITGYGDVLVATTWNYGGVYRSGDRGRTWTPISDGLPLTTDGRFQGANDLATVGTSIYVAAPTDFTGISSAPVYRSDDGGEHWTEISKGLPFRKFGPSDSSAVNVDVFHVKDGVLFAGCEPGIWMLTPGATRWISITEDIQQCRVNALIADDTYLYASMNNCGMWRRPLSTLVMGVEKEEPARMPSDASRFNLAVIPNPVTASTRVRFTLPGTARTTVTLHDAAGGLVRVIASGTMGHGEHELMLDGAGLSSGAYFVRVESGKGNETVGMIFER